MKNRNADLYLSDLCSNIESRRLNADQIRSKLMFQLLFWDTLSVADSQLLCSPELCSLVLGGERTAHKIGCFCDVDHLLEAGLISCVHREDDSDDGHVELHEAWEELYAREGSDSIADILTSRQQAIEMEPFIKNHKTWNISRVASKFKENLILGVECEHPLIDAHADHAVDRMLAELIAANRPEQKVYFADLLQVIKEAQSRQEISTERYIQLYNFFESSYSANVPASLGLYFETEMDTIPIHLALEDAGHGEKIREGTYSLNSSYIFRPEYLHHIPMDAFIEIRENFRKHFASSNGEKGDMQMLNDYVTGNLGTNSYFSEFWDECISYLEREMKFAFMDLRDRMDDENYRFRMEECATKAQLTHLGKDIAGEVGINIIGLAFPAVGTISSISNFARQAFDIAENARYGRMEHFAEQYEFIRSYLEQARRNERMGVQKHVIITRVKDD